MKNQQQTEEKEVIILSYLSNEEIHITLSSIIKVGLLTLKRLDGSTIYQKVITNTNYEHIIIPDNQKELVLSIISDSIHYEKILTVHKPSI